MKSEDEHEESPNCRVIDGLGVGMGGGGGAVGEASDFPGVRFPLSPQGCKESGQVCSDSCFPGTSAVAEH